MTGEVIPFPGQEERVTKHTAQVGTDWAYFIQTDVEPLIAQVDTLALMQGEEFWEQVVWLRNELNTWLNDG